MIRNCNCPQIDILISDLPPMFSGVKTQYKLTHITIITNMQKLYRIIVIFRGGLIMIAINLLSLEWSCWFSSTQVRLSEQCEISFTTT